MQAVRRLQLGVGKSVIVDLPEEAGEIYVRDPKIANAIVRSARRVYVSGVANGQTSIFAFARDGRKIATIQVSVGRDVGEVSALLNAAIPGNDIHVRTVADKIILTGTVASAEEAQKALDIASGFVADSPPSASSGTSISISNGSGESPSSGSTPSGRSKNVINSLTIRGLDQVSLRVTIAEIRREIIKQLGVNLSGTGTNGSFTLDNPFAINGAGATSQAMLNWVKGNQSFRPPCRRSSGKAWLTRSPSPRSPQFRAKARNFSPAARCQSSTGRILLQRSYNYRLAPPTLIQQPYGVTLNFTPVVLSQGRIQLRIATEVTDVDYSTGSHFLRHLVPGFRTRSNTTTVELPSGGSVAPRA